MTGRPCERLDLIVVLAGLALSLGALHRPAVADDPQAADTPSARALLKIYQDRCQRDVDVLARSLDALDTQLRGRVRALDARIQQWVDEIQAQVLEPVSFASEGELWDVVADAWDQRCEAQRLYRALQDCPRHYNEWARKAGLRAAFSVKEDVVLHENRREAIRTLLLPILADPGRGGWSTPNEDARDWRESGSARLFEFLILLRWLSGEADDLGDFDRSWFREQAGAGLVKRWIPQAAMPSTRRLHDQYVFETLRPPAELKAVPSRVRAVLEVLVRPGPADRSRRIESAVRKDDFLVALLQLVATGRGDETAASWFSFAGRCLPPFTAMRPTLDRVTGEIRALEDRPCSLVKTLYDELRQADGVDRSILDAVRNGIYWPQLLGTDPEGRPSRRGVVWSGFVETEPAQAAGKKPAVVAAQPGGAQTAQAPEPAEQTLGPFAPESAWGQTCESIAMLLAGRRLLVTGRPLRVAVENRTPWRIAFGVDELAEVLGRKLPPGAKQVEAVEPNASDADLRAVVLRVDGGEAIALELEWAGERLASRRICVIPAWPAWFAIGPAWDGWDRLYLVLAALAVVAAMGCGWFSARPELGLRRRLFSPFGLVLLMFLPATWPFLRDGAAPRSSLARGGRIVFEVPAGPGLPSELKDFTAVVCAKVCRALSVQAISAEAGEGVGPWDGWLAALAALAKHEPEPVSSDRVVDLRYDVWSTTWRDGYRRTELGQGRLRDATETSFRKMLDQADAWEPDEPELPRALLGNLGPGVTLAVVIHDGDHGGLVAPPAPDRKGPVLSVWIATGTRDGRPRAALGARARFQRLEQGSQVALSVLSGVGAQAVPALQAMADGSRLADLDRSAAEPVDFGALRDRLWNFGRKADLKQRHAFAEEAGHHALKIYQTTRPATSRTALRRGWGACDSVWIALVPWLLALLWWSQLPASSGRTWRSVLQAAVVALVVLVLVLAVVYGLVLRRGGYGVLGVGIVEGLSRAYVAVAIGVILAVALAFVTWGLESQLDAAYSRRVRDGRGLWAPQAPATRFRDMNLGLLVVRLLGLVLLGVALACWTSEPVAESGAGTWGFLPGERSGLLAGLCLWAVGVVALGPWPIRLGSRRAHTRAR